MGFRSLIRVFNVRAMAHLYLAQKYLNLDWDSSGECKKSKVIIYWDWLEIKNVLMITNY